MQDGPLQEGKMYQTGDERVKKKIHYEEYVFKLIIDSYYR